MAVGMQALSCYEDEDVSWQFTYSDAVAPSITGWDIRGQIRTTASSPTTAIGPIVCTINDSTHFTFATNIALSPGTYVYSMRRIDAGFSWQLAQGELTVVDSASIT